MCAKHYRNHATDHESDGDDEIGEGQLLPQDPTSHASDHIDGGSDEITSPLSEKAYPLDYGDSLPSTDTDGKMFWDSSNTTLHMYDGSEWKTIGVMNHDDLNSVLENAHHEKFTPSDHDSRDHSNISDTVKLDEWEPPTNSVDINEQKLKNVDDPSDPHDAATRTWVESNFNDYSLESHDNTYHDSDYTTYDSGDFDSDFDSKDTDDLDEGSNNKYFFDHDNSNHDFDNVVSGEGKEYEIQKNGSDDKGIINFKT